MLLEAPLSKTKLIIRGAMWLLAVQLTAQTLPDGPGVTVNAGAPLLHRTPVFHPGGSVTGTVIVDASVSAKGEVTDARVVSGPEELRKAVLANVLNWHYAPPAPTSARVTVLFADAAGAPFPASPPVPGAGGRGGRGAVQGPEVVSAIRTDGLSAELARLAVDALGVKGGDTLPTPWDPMPKLREVDEHLRSFNVRDAEGKTTILLSLGTPVLPAGEGTQRVSSGVARGLLESQVPPVYPPIARQARVQGAVLLSVVIGKDGHVKQLSVVSGPAMLRDAALASVMQWVYKPMLLNGQTVEVLTEVEVNFSLLP